MSEQQDDEKALNGGSRSNVELDHVFRALPEETPPGLLMSMALRYDHGLGLLGYYDIFGEGEHKKRLKAALILMRQIYEEVSGHDFYIPDSEHRYVEMMGANFEVSGRQRTGGNDDNEH